MTAKTKAVCDQCKRVIHGDAILIVPPNLEILLGVNSVVYLHKKCAEKRGVDLSSVE